MSRYRLVALSLVGIVATTTPVVAQTPVEDDEVLEEVVVDRNACAKQDAPAAPSNVLTTPITRADWEITGRLIDPVPTIRALMAPTMDRHRALTEDARKEIAVAANRVGYHVVGIGTRESAAGTIAIVHLSPLPMTRKVNVNVKYNSVLSTVVDDEIKRRMKVRAGMYLKWSPRDRACELFEEAERVETYLRDDGYADAQVSIKHAIKGIGVKLDVNVVLGEEYTTDVDRLEIVGERLAVSTAEIRAKFRHLGTCVIGSFLCYGRTPRFTRATHQDDVQAVIRLFHRHGYPEVRVRSDFSPERSFDRRSKTVRFTLTIDQRRRLDVTFEGSTFPTDTLKSQLTFNEAASIDDVEANESARKITTFLQSRGHFDARVTWVRERFEALDHMVFRIDQGRTRRVNSVAFRGNRALSAEALEAVVGTKPRTTTGTLLGANTAATSEMLASDVDGIVDLYRRNGYRDTAVRVGASTDPGALESAALTAAMLGAARGDGLHVRFTIDEGQPTLLTQVHIELGEQGDVLATPAQRTLCQLILRDLAALYEHAPLGTLATPDRCIAVATNLRFREDDALATRDELKDRLYSHGRPRAEVAYEPVVIGPHRVAAHYKLAHVQELKIGKVVIRGNFKTRSSIIKDQLDFKEGALFTKDRLAEGARRLRSTGLFDSVNIAMPDLDTTSEGGINAIVDVTERYDHAVELLAEAGYSSFNGAFVKATPSLKNLFGRGISLDVSGTIGFDPVVLLDQGDLQLRQLSADSTLRIPQWLSRSISPIEFQTEATLFHRRQETPRFGLLRTTGATLALSRTSERQRVGSIPARAITGGVHYDFRSRERNVDALRPIGADDDESQVPITTITGSVGASFEWEQRVDRIGNLSPLAPEAGFRLDAQVSFASPYLLGQDTFIKISAAGSKYWPIGDQLVLRADLRYDQGFPLGNAAILPEVERFFAGGDSTVRGYDDERLATESVLVGVPPLDNVQQIRLLPTGGNIRVLGSLDAQLRIYKVFATALFLDAGMIKNQWSSVTVEYCDGIPCDIPDVRPSVGMALFRIVTPFGAIALERALPLRPRLGDDPRGRWHISFAARAQF